jgi:hypothetical protein
LSGASTDRRLLRTPPSTSFSFRVTEVLKVKRAP